MSTLRHRNSKTLTRSIDSSVYVGIYHETPTLVYDKITNDVIFRNGGWVTPSTCKSQTFFLEEIGLSNLRVGIKKGTPYLFVKEDKNPIAKIEHKTVMSYTDLQRLDERGQHVENRELRSGNRTAETEAA
jgi:hypothetical protein